MKTFQSALLIMVLLATVSCQKEPVIRFGFDTEFGKNSQGLTVMNVGKTSNVVSLEGEIVVMEGHVLVELIDPMGDTVFTSNLPAPLSQYVNNSFPAVKGNWKLKYTSMEGAGLINLHLNVYSRNPQ